MNLRLTKILNKHNNKIHKEIEYNILNIPPGVSIEHAAKTAMNRYNIHKIHIEFNFNGIVIKTFKNCNAQNLVNQYYHAIKDRR